LASSLRDLILSGELKSGDALPSERTLAEILRLSRTTVTTAYRSLRDEGWLLSFPGSGNYVWQAAPEGTRSQSAERLQSFLVGESQEIDFTSGALPGLPLVLDAIKMLPLGLLEDLVAGHGYLPQGLPGLLDQIARYCTQLGLPTVPEQILVTDGSQNALRLIADLLLQEGDSVIVEDPTFRGSIDVFRGRGAEVFPVHRDPDGVDLSEISQVMRASGARLLYLLPNAHNPTGATMSEDRRHELGRLIQRSAVKVIDDGSTMEPLFSGQPRPLALDLPPDSVISVGSMSKLFWGGLRVGWIRADPALIRRLTQIRGANSLGGAVVSQVIAAHLMADIESARRERRQQLWLGVNNLSAQLRQFLPDWRWAMPTGGASLWIDTGSDSIALAHTARQRGVLITPGPTFSAKDGFRTHIRLPIWHPAIVQEQAVRRLSLAAYDLT
jgi:DNA-binding transcriptional MocR family regulator